MPRNARTQLAKVSEANTAALVREDGDRIARKAMEMRRKGMSYYEIAERLGVPESKAAGLAHQAIRAAADMVSRATREEILCLEVERLDALQNAIYDDAMAGDISAVREIRGIIMDRARLQQILDGPAATTTHQTVIIAGDSKEYRDAMEKIRQGITG